MSTITLFPHYSPVDTIVIQAPTLAALLEAVAAHARGNDAANADGLMVGVEDGYINMLRTDSGAWNIYSSDDNGNDCEPLLTGATFDEALAYFLQVVKQEVGRPD